MSKTILTKRIFQLGLSSTIPASASTDVPNLQQVQQIADGRDNVKDSVRVAERDSDLALTGLVSIDGVTVEAGDRVLVSAQTDASENGIWVASAGAWARSTDADTGEELKPYVQVFARQGTEHAGHKYVLQADDPITVGTTDQTWVHESTVSGNASDIEVTQTSFSVIAGADVQTALDSVDDEIAANDALIAAIDTRVTTAETDIDDLEALSGFAGAADTGTMGGVHTVDDSTLKANILALDTEIDANKKVTSTAVDLTTGVWTTVTHNLNDARLSAIAVYDAGDSYKLITETVEIRPKSADANSIEIYHEQGSTLTVDVAMRK